MSRGEKSTVSEILKRVDMQWKGEKRSLCLSFTHFCDSGQRRYILRVSCSVYACAHIAGQIALFFPPFFTSRYSTNTCNLAPVLFSVCYFVRVGTGFPKSCFTSSPVLPHVLVSLAILPWSSAPNPPNKQRRIGQGQETLTGQGQETFCQCKPCHWV